MNRASIRGEQEITVLKTWTLKISEEVDVDFVENMTRLEVADAIFRGSAIEAFDVETGGIRLNDSADLRAI